ncbi:hypothetical protein A1Q1_02463 [Trichosporon asahii var. asahii CBS 2479]|uniref:SAC domain-containing protein n=1 Tax=Trichosporon asahii var. asahii (strain ATCC 90039 / CBS 2479 / JCM 2466 / KCTC 7840 / NBRC 103889/ NCYC 2677 / UAMH 7654) TaxID=1186058 RepID=J4UC79_TRIAS|nr:hypothetical protein A1Q1_02463 [Trichosporon asahii var. asahii CBS 2479]EJT48555.1 hypothetical protein A1Q1_02463 [Trichosporon asahii var. asahii CBS 2479]
MSSPSTPVATPMLKHLPPRLTVPPLPPQLHRRLRVRAIDDGLLLYPGTNSEPEDAVLIRYGIKAKVEAFAVPPADESLEGEVELGGVVAAYLVVFLPAKKPPTSIFPGDNGITPTDVTHEVNTLTDVYAIPLIKERAERHLGQMSRILRVPKAPKSKAKTSPKPKQKPPALNLKWPWQAGASSATSDDDGSSSDAESSSEDDESDIEARRRRSSSVAPEADEDLPTLPPAVDDSAESRMKKRFSLGWGKFTPKLGKAKPKDKIPPAKESATEVREEQPEDPVGDVEPEDVADAHDDEGGIEMTSPGLKVPKTDSAAPSSAPSRATTPVPKPALDVPARLELESKIMKQITRELGSGEFYYSYDFDLSHTLQDKRKRLARGQKSGALLEGLLSSANPTSEFFDNTPSETDRKLHSDPPSPGGSVKSAKSTRTTGSEIIEPDIHVPLWRRTDRRFFWNESLARDFIELGLHGYVLPILQGYVQASQFTVPIPPSPVDEAKLLEPPAPVPVDIVLISRRSKDRAGLRYQRRGIDDEGHVANFVETEMLVRAKVGGKVSMFSFVQIRGSIPLKWSQTPWSMKPPPVLDQPVDQTYSVANLHFDDLRKRYGPVTGKEAPVTNGYGELVDSLERPDLTYVPFDFHAKCHGMKWEHISELVNELDFTDMGYLWLLQGDELTSSCIDCLDRTNVVQSALARHVLKQMLLQLGITVDPKTCDVESVFNDTLKGDFVRTGKRDLQGMLAQSSARVLDNGEQRIGGWTLLSPAERNTKLSPKLEEKVLLLLALYVVSFNYSLEKVNEFTRIPLKSITSLQKGAYILSALQEAGRDPTENAGFVVTFAAADESTRYSTYSLDNTVATPPTPTSTISQASTTTGTDPLKSETKRNRARTLSFKRKSIMKLADVDPDTSEFFAFKALPREFVAQPHPEDDEDEEFTLEQNETCMATVDRIVKRIREQCAKVHKVPDDFVVDKDVVSVADAENATSLLARMDYAVKRFLPRSCARGGSRRGRQITRGCPSVEHANLLGSIALFSIFQTPIDQLSQAIPVHRDNFCDSTRKNERRKRIPPAHDSAYITGPSRPLGYPIIAHDFAAMSFHDLGRSPLSPPRSVGTTSSGSQRSNPSPTRGRAGSVDPSSSPSRAPQPTRGKLSPTQRAQLYYMRINEQSIYEGGVLRAFQWKILHPDEPEAKELFLQFRKMISADVPYKDRDSEVEKREAGEMWAELTRIIAAEVEERERKKNVG